LYLLDAFVWNTIIPAAAGRARVLFSTRSFRRRGGAHHGMAHASRGRSLKKSGVIVERTM
jgi:hypothetical protein